jgi:hypothetical protein
MLVRMNAREIAGSYFATRARDVSAGRVELARVAVALVPARGDGLGVRAMALVVTRAALRRTERRDDHKRKSYRNTHPLQHDDLDAGAVPSRRAENSTASVGLRL